MMCERVRVFWILEIRILTHQVVKITPRAWLAGVCIIVVLVSISSGKWLCFVCFLVNVGLLELELPPPTYTRFPVPHHLPVPPISHEFPMNFAFIFVMHLFCVSIVERFEFEKSAVPIQCIIILLLQELDDCIHCEPNASLLCPQQLGATLTCYTFQWYLMCSLGFSLSWRLQCCCELFVWLQRLSRMPKGFTKLGPIVRSYP